MAPMVVTGVIPSASEEEAIGLANSTVYGFAGDVWASNLSRAHWMIGGMRTGVKHVNTYGGPDVTVPLGSIGKSANSAYNPLHAMDKYVNLKAVWIKQ